MQMVWRVSVLFILFSWSALGCGVEWRLPQDHFNGVNESGFLNYWQKVGDVDLGDGLVLPLIIGFLSERADPSPYLGQGWTLALLESRLIQINDRTFLMIKPDGWCHFFWKDRKDPNLLNGGSWKATVDKNVITAWAECGWKLIYTDGKLTSMTTPKNRELKFLRAGTPGIQENGKMLLKVENDPRTGKPAALTFNEKRVVFELGDKPKIQIVNGKTSVLKDQSLKKLVDANNVTHLFEFSINKQSQPTLKVSGASERLFAWDPKTNLIISDGDWNYDIKTDPKNPRANAAIGRKNSKGESEFWHDDDAKGSETVQKADGTETVRSWFTSGNLKGKTRKVEQTKNGETTTTYRPVYDENKRLLRETRKVNGEDVTTTFEYDPRGNQISASSNGKIVWKKEFDDRNRILASEYPGQKKTDYKYLENGNVEKTESSISKKDETSFEVTSVQVYDPKGKRLSRKDAQGKLWTYDYNEMGKEKNTFLNGTLYRTTSYYPDGQVSQTLDYDSTGKVVVTEHNMEYKLVNNSKTVIENIIDHKNNRNFSITLRYDDKGRIVEHANSLSGAYSYTYDSNGERHQTFTQIKKS